jgi:hypothetical protein
MPEAFKWDGERLTWPDLHSWILEIYGRIDERRAAGTWNDSNEPAFSSHLFAKSIISHFLGVDWFDIHAMPESDPKSHFHPRFDGRDGAASGYTARVFNLAECLFNLQTVENFAHPLQGLTTDRDNMEAYLAELQIGMILLQESIRFRYLSPNNTPGVRTPDLEITIGDVRALADVKCKYEIKVYEQGCLKSPFRDAARQIGSGNNGIIFVKVPQAWTQNRGNDILLPQTLADEARRRMSNYSRIVKTVFYTFHLSEDDENMRNLHAVVELPNPKNGAGSPWNERLFSFMKPPVWHTVVGMIERVQRGE